MSVPDESFFCICPVLRKVSEEVGVAGRAGHTRAWQRRASGQCHLLECWCQG